MVLSQSPVQHHRDGLGDDVLCNDEEPHDGGGICADGQPITLAGGLGDDLTCTEAYSSYRDINSDAIASN